MSIVRAYLVLLMIYVFTTQAVFANTSLVWGGNAGTFEKKVVGVGLEARIELYPPSERDATLRATKWDMTNPEAAWVSTMRQLPEFTDRDYVRFYIDVPGMIRNIVEVGLTTDQDGTTLYKAHHIPNKGYAVDLSPGSLPIGATALMPYVIHRNDKGGITILIFTFQWRKEGEISSGFHVIVRRAPDDFDELYAPWREKFRSGFRAIDAESYLSDKDKEDLAAYRKQRDSQRAARMEESRRRELVASGQACPICLSARNDIVQHSLEMCPSLHPSAETGNQLAPDEVVTAPVVTQPTAVQPVSHVNRPAVQSQVVTRPSVVQPAIPSVPTGVHPRAWQRAMVTYERHPMQPGMGKVIVVVSDRNGNPVRGQPILDLSWGAGKQGYYLAPPPSPDAGVLSFNAAPGSTYRMSIRGDRRVYTAQAQLGQPKFVFITL